MCRCFCNKNLEHYYQPGSYKDSLRERRRDFGQLKQNLVSLAHNVTQYWWKYKGAAVIHW